MKKVILLTACTAAVLLSGCSDNELASVGDGIGTSAQNAIGFHVVGNQAETRATPITPSNITNTDFNVYAYINKANNSDGEPFMGGNDTALGSNGINISHNGKVWGYTNDKDLRYWPTTALNFYAVNPATTGMFSWQFSNAKKEIAYNCFDEYAKDNKGEYSNAKNIDVMYAVAKGQTYTQKNSGIVKFNFKHILSQVVFQAKTQYANMEVEIKALSIHNFYGGGTFTIPEGEPSQTNWKPTPLTYHSNGFTAVMDQSIKVNKTDEVTNISTQGPMLLVPQKLTKWDRTGNTEAANTAKQSYLKITCKIKQSGAYLFGDDTNFGVLYVPFGADWQPGKRYIYTLIFGGGFDAQGQAILMPINFEAETTNWVNDSNNNDININK